MKKITLLAVAFVATMLMSANAQTEIVKWDFSGIVAEDNFGASPFAPAARDANLTLLGGLSRGWNLSGTGTPAASGWGGNGFTATSFDAAVAANEFVLFALTANTDFLLSLSSIDEYNIRRSAQGPTTGQWQYSTAGEFVNIGAPITWGTGTSGTGNRQATIDLSAISALQNVPAGTAVVFRLVVWGATGTGGTFYFNGRTDAGSLGLSIIGTVELANSIPDAPVADDCVSTGWFNIMGQKLNAAPEKGVYIETYSNCPAQKIVK